MRLKPNKKGKGSAGDDKGKKGSKKQQKGGGDKDRGRDDGKSKGKGKGKDKGRKGPLKDKKGRVVECIHCGDNHYVTQCEKVPEERKEWSFKQHLDAKRKEDSKSPGSGSGGSKKRKDNSNHPGVANLLQMKLPRTKPQARLLKPLPGGWERNS